MAEFPHMPLATDAYLGDTRHLSTLEHGAYLLLLITAWRCRGRPQLPNDDKVLARWAGLDARSWQRVRDTVMAFWTLGDDGFWTQAKQLQVRDVVHKNAENQRRKAAQRWGRKALENNETGDAVGYAGDMPGECQPKPKPSKTPIVPNGTGAADGYGDEADPLYADFLANVWGKRWKRKGHEPLPAFRAYRRLTPKDRENCKAEIERAGRGIEAAASEEKFRPMLATWINRRGWEADAGNAQETSGTNWPAWVAAFRANGDWNPVALGPEPGQPGCRVPREFLVGLAADPHKAA